MPGLGKIPQHGVTDPTIELRCTTVRTQVGEYICHVIFLTQNHTSPERDSSANPGSPKRDSVKRNLANQEMVNLSRANRDSRHVNIEDIKK